MRTIRKSVHNPHAHEHDVAAHLCSPCTSPLVFRARTPLPRACQGQPMVQGRSYPGVVAGAQRPQLLRCPPTPPPPLPRRSRSLCRPTLRPRPPPCRCCCCRLPPCVLTLRPQALTPVTPPARWALPACSGRPRPQSQPPTGASTLPTRACVPGAKPCYVIRDVIRDNGSEPARVPQDTLYVDLLIRFFSTSRHVRVQSLSREVDGLGILPFLCKGVQDLDSHGQHPSR